MRKAISMKKAVICFRHSVARLAPDERFWEDELANWRLGSTLVPLDDMRRRVNEGSRSIKELTQIFELFIAHPTTPKFLPFAKALPQLCWHLVTTRYFQASERSSTLVYRAFDGKHLEVLALGNQRDILRTELEAWRVKLRDIDLHIEAAARTRRVVERSMVDTQHAGSPEQPVLFGVLPRDYASEILWDSLLYQRVETLLPRSRHSPRLRSFRVGIPSRHRWLVWEALSDFEGRPRSLMARLHRTCVGPVSTEPFDLTPDGLVRTGLEDL